MQECSFPVATRGTATKTAKLHFDLKYSSWWSLKTRKWKLWFSHCDVVMLRSLSIRWFTEHTWELDFQPSFCLNEIHHSELHVHPHSFLLQVSLSHWEKKDDTALYLHDDTECSSSLRHKPDQQESVNSQLMGVPKKCPWPVGAEFAVISCSFVFICRVVSCVNQTLIPHDDPQAAAAAVEGSKSLATSAGGEGDAAPSSPLGTSESDSVFNQINLTIREESDEYQKSSLIRNLKSPAVFCSCQQANICVSG